VHQARHRQLRAWIEQALADHRHAQISLSAALATDQPLQIEFAQHPEHRRDVPVRQRAQDLELLVEVDQPPAGEHRPQPVDHPLLQVREVPDRLVLDLAALAVGAAEQRGRVLRPFVVATRDGYVNLSTPFRHRQIISDHGRNVKQFSVYISKRKRGPIALKHGRSGLNPSKTSG